MTAVPDLHVFDTPGSDARTGRHRDVATTTETYWGYRIDGLRASVWVMAVQGLSWAIGVVLCMVAIGIWVLPGAGGLVAFKLGASVPMGAVAGLLLWHASGGTALAVEVDLRLGEVREVLRNRAGRTTVLSRWGFDAIGEVYLEPVAGQPRKVELVMGFRGSAQVLRVARGPEVALVDLGDRLARDLMVGDRGRVAAGDAVAREVADAA